MKREIDCLDCARKWRGGEPTYLPEGKKYVHGKALRGLMCDGCGKDIAQGDECVAFSLFTADHHYFEWEDEYITPSRPRARL
jgi:hypothetical protein